MAYEEIPAQIPEKGFYYHYKHDLAGPMNDYAYEVIGVARHTEERTFTVLYRPLYENEWFKPADYQARPLGMFMEEVEKEGVRTPRFTRITDPATITALERIKETMYPSETRG